MTVLNTTTNVPLEMGADKIIRVAQTRVTLDVVVSAFLNGSTAEEIVYQYPVLDLADVYTVIAYYLKNQAEVDAYLDTTGLASERIRIEVQERFPAADIRNRLTARLLNASKADV